MSLRSSHRGWKIALAAFVVGSFASIAAASPDANGPSAVAGKAIAPVSPEIGDMIFAQVAGRGGSTNSSSTHGGEGSSAGGSGATVASIEDASERTQEAIAACGVRDLHTTSLCIADALDAYADELERLAPNLPPRLAGLPAIVRYAATKVRSARTKAEAVNALKTAQTSVNHAIALLRADDPNSIKTAAQVGRDVNETLGVAEEALLRSSEL